MPYCKSFSELIFLSHRFAMTRIFSGSQRLLRKSFEVASRVWMSHGRVSRSVPLPTRSKSQNNSIAASPRSAIFPRFYSSSFLITIRLYTQVLGSERQFLLFLLSAARERLGGDNQRAANYEHQHPAEDTARSSGGEYHQSMQSYCDEIWLERTTNQQMMKTKGPENGYGARTRWRVSPPVTRESWDLCVRSQKNSRV